MTTTNAGKDVKQQELPFSTGDNAKRYRHFGRQFGGPYKTKHTTTIQFINRVPWYLLKGVET